MQKALYSDACSLLRIVKLSAESGHVCLVGPVALYIGSGKVVLFTLNRSLMEEGLLASDGAQAGAESDCG